MSARSCLNLSPSGQWPSGSLSTAPTPRRLCGRLCAITHLGRDPDEWDIRFTIDTWPRGSTTMHRSTVLLPCWHLSFVGDAAFGAKHAERAAFRSALDYLA